MMIYAVMRGSVKATVIRGLDPRIHRFGKTASLRRSMGCRVKPGNDALRPISRPATTDLRPMSSPATTH
jgi:hypothetical protein